MTVNWTPARIVGVGSCLIGLCLFAYEATQPDAGMYASRLAIADSGAWSIAYDQQEAHLHAMDADGGRFLIFGTILVLSPWGWITRSRRS